MSGPQDRVRHDGGWRRRASRYLYRSRWFHLRQDDVTLPSGEDIVYTQVEHPGYVIVVPLRDDGLVVMERVYRWTVQRTLLECPSGGRDGEAPETAARRELEEETGYVGGTWTHLGNFLGSKGMSDEEFDVFLATGVRPEGVVRLEPPEQLTVELIPFAELRDSALRGELEDAPSALALLLAWNQWTRGAGVTSTRDLRE